MKLKNLIPEALKPIDIDDSQIGILKDHEKLIEQISSSLKTCSEAYGVAFKQKKALHRNSERSGFGSFLKPRGSKRKPVDTHATVDEFFENFRKKHYSSKIPSRQKSAFTYCVEIKDNQKSEVPMPAMMYGGNRFFVFPKNGTKYFQTNIEKFQDFTQSRLNTDIQNHVNWIEDGEHDPEVMKRQYAVLKGHLDEYLSNSNTKLKDMKPTYAEVWFEHKGYQTINATRVLGLCDALQIPQHQLFHAPTINKLEKLL